MTETFLVGAPRSGTTWTQRLLGAHPAIATPQETFVIGHYIASAAKAWGRHRDRLDAELDRDVQKERFVGLPILLTDEQFWAWAGGLLDAVFVASLGAKPGATTVVEKTPEHIEHLDLIHTLRPAARFVHIHRDPVDQINSLRRAPWQEGHPERDLYWFAALWRRAIRGVARFEREHPELIRSWAYDDLRADPVTVLGEILDFIDLPLPPSEVQGLVDAVAANDSNESSELVFAGVLAARGGRLTEPVGFDVRSRGAHPPMGRLEVRLIRTMLFESWKLGYPRPRGIVRGAPRAAEEVLRWRERLGRPVRALTERGRAEPG